MKLTSKIALGFVERIEALNDQINAVYREVGEYDDCVDAIYGIREIVAARTAAKEQNDIAEGTLEAFDLDNEND